MYKYPDLIKLAFDPYIYPSIASQVDLVGAANSAARQVLFDLDTTGTKRITSLPTNLFDEQFDYQAPPDLKDFSLCDIMPQYGRRHLDEWHYVDPVTFDRLKYTRPWIMTTDILNNVARIRATLQNRGLESLLIAQLDSPTADGGTWVAFGDAINVRGDSDDFVKGNGSTKFDLGGTQTTSGIQNTTLPAFDYSEYVQNNRSIFLRMKLSDPTSVTNVKVRIGSGVSNYDELTATATIVNTPFTQGWQIVKMDFINKVTTGNPVRTAATFVAIFLTKDAAKIGTDYGFDYLIAQQGKYHNFVYYSNCPWQDMNGNYMTDSTGAATDVLNADAPHDIQLFVKALRVEVDKRLKDYIQYQLDKADYDATVKQYEQDHPSNALLLEQTYYETQGYNEFVDRSFNDWERGETW